MATVVPLQEIGQEQILYKLIGANMNVTTDQPFLPQGGTPFGDYLITRIICTNASLSLTTAAGGIYTAASKGGNAIVASGQAYSTLTGATLGFDLTIAAVGRGPQSGVPILSLTTGQGAAATADFYVVGIHKAGLQ
jgi:hypothetical protein